MTQATGAEPSTPPKQASQEDKSKVNGVELSKPEIRTHTLSKSQAQKLAKEVQTSDKGFDMVAYNQFLVMATDFMTGKAVPKGFETPQQVQVALIAGKEMGLTAVRSLKSFYFVNGMINIWGSAVPYQMRRHGWDFQFVNETKDSCTIKAWKKDNDDTPIEDTFTFQDAEQSGWTKDWKKNLKPGWYPGANRKRKLRYGAIAQLVNTYIPEVLGAAVGVAEVSIDYDESQKVNDEPRAEEVPQTAQVKDTKPKPVEVGTDE